MSLRSKVLGKQRPSRKSRAQRGDYGVIAAQRPVEALVRGQNPIVTPLRMKACLPRTRRARRGVVRG